MKYLPLLNCFQSNCIRFWRGRGEYPLIAFSVIANTELNLFPCIVVLYLEKKITVGLVNIGRVERLGLPPVG